MRHHISLNIKISYLELKLLCTLTTVIIDYDVTMSEVYQAKHSFRGLEEYGVYELQPTESASNSPSPTRNVNENNNKIETDHYDKLSKCFAKMASDAILRSPILSVKLEKCNSEPNVSKESASADGENKPNTCSGSPCHSSQSENSLAGISTPCVKQSQRKLILAFDEGDTFEVSNYM
jgi:hypothetical protein